MHFVSRRASRLQNAHGLRVARCPRRSVWSRLSAFACASAGRRKAGLDRRRVIEPRRAIVNRNGQHLFFPSPTTIHPSAHPHIRTSIHLHLQPPSAHTVREVSLAYYRHAQQTRSWRHAGWRADRLWCPLRNHSSTPAPHSDRRLAGHLQRPHAPHRLCILAMGTFQFQVAWCFNRPTRVFVAS